VALAVRVFHLGSQSLWIDEILTWYSAGIGTRLQARDLVENVHGPLYALLLHAWCLVAGGSEWAMRAPSALYGAAMVPAMAVLAAAWLGPETAVMAAWLAALSPFMVWYGQEARNYTLLMLCVCLAGIALLGLRARLSAGGIAGALTAVAAGALSSFSFALLVPLHLGWWLADRATRVRRLGLLAAAAVGLALLLSPWIPQVARIWDFQRLTPGHGAGEPALRGTTTFHPVAIPFALHALAVGYTLGPSLRELRADPAPATLWRHALELAAVALVFGALGVLGLRALARRGRVTDALLWLLVPALVVSWFAVRNFKVFHPRYLAVSAPAFLLVIAAGLADLRPRARAAALGALALLWGASLAHHYFDPRYGKEDYRGAAALVAARAVPGEKVLAVGAEDPLFYYYHGPAPLERFWLGFVRRPARLKQKWDEARSGVDGVWVVLSRPEDLDPDGRFETFIAGYGPQVFEFEGVRIWHWKAPGAATGPPVIR
jgi:4-amino-4-deoxy-L-arabinose transferase-like glycosyltransferase